MTLCSVQEQICWIQSHDHLSKTQTLLCKKEIAFYCTEIKPYYSAELCNMKDAARLLGLAICSTV
jgi:hypothetical protein